MPRTCPACRSAIPDGQRFCGACGAEAAPPTVAATATSASEAYGAPLSPAELGGRFAPGTVVATRYRIVGLLGRGGMGEVYRADDLKLGRPVALKFLPAEVERAPGRLNRLLNEVRAAVRVSHPNVCRVHDVHEEAGRHFLTMEFVDGDDLSALLRRIGRLPSDKALEIARQLCAGLGAAHAAGVLHRDLKPSNVMIDGRGQVKITDFGLAGVAGEFEGDEIRAGTPAYMAPEQLAGKEVTHASDLYALGLVLYEVYTGRPAYESGSVAQIVERRASAPTSPSSHVTDIDPAVERVILRCLETDPADRPRSALAVSAALPGGDPLADALAAGETPAPELVAAAGAVGGLSPAKGAWLLAGIGALVALDIVGVSRFHPVSRADLPVPAVVLEAKAQEIVKSLGFEVPARDRIWELSFNDDLIRHLTAERASRETWARLERAQPAPLLFGYRRSPDWLDYESAAVIGDWIKRTPPTDPGGVRLKLDPMGRLFWLDAVPYETKGEAPARSDWPPLLAAAGLDPARLRETDASWVPPRGFDERKAWEGVYPDAPEVPIRVEAAAYDGRPVAFRILEPWSSAREAASVVSMGPAASGGIGALLLPTLFLVALVTLCALAWRNVRLGRGDRRTAVRFALLFTGLRMVWYLFTHHTASPLEVNQLQSHLAWALFRFGLAYGFYLAVEPYARKLWPRMLTSWVRFFDNRFRDPLVGRDVLIGVAVGSLMSAGRWGLSGLNEAFSWGPMSLVTSEFALESMRGFPGALVGWSASVTESLFGTVMFVTLALVFRLALRRDTLTLIPLLLIGILFESGGGFGLVTVLTGIWFITLPWLTLFRVGLLAFAVAMITSDLLTVMPLTFDLGAWWAAPTWVTLGFVALAAGWGWRVAVVGGSAGRVG